MTAHFAAVHENSGHMLEALWPLTGMSAFCWTAIFSLKLEQAAFEPILTRESGVWEPKQEIALVLSAYCGHSVTISIGLQQV